MKTVLQSHWRTFWQQRNARERVVLRLLFCFLITALAAQMLWSLEQARRGLTRQLPVLAEQAEQMHALQNIWQQLNTARSVENKPRPALARPEIERRLTELGKEINAEWAANGELRLKGRTDFSVWLTWAASLHEAHRLVIRRCQISASPGAGVEIDASFSPEPPGQ